MMKLKVLSTLIVLVTMISFHSQAQPGGRMDPKDMVMREKQNLYSKAEGLSDDQKLIIDGVYDEFAQSIIETFEEGRQNRNRDEMRQKMEALRLEKDELMKDILREDQYAVYVEITEAQRKRMQERQENRPSDQAPQ
ncbi:hypothetical protein N6H18_06920 [Reichenbachiella agarivorans]|uniref:LTXXQ motif family protein n=1 Tax=Reichenbachiella agarivorans TaxID=2979464 RepID=A0ABY6CT38_9BACT|nr:hypothetical protein [Reichenbachiella agarivorans]UXP33684.1 hypothetical protein N6H18_06920 [Reichenbachiella agarivorans]